MATTHANPASRLPADAPAVTVDRLSSIRLSGGAGGDVVARALLWAPIVLGLCVLYLPTLHDLFTGIWAQPEQFHGPVVLAIALWLLYRNWAAMEAAAEGRAPSAWGWVAVVGALLLYAVGRSQQVGIFEVGSVIPLLAGLILLVYGAAALKKQWFALFFMLFMVPLPAAVVNTLTMPMKIAVSVVTEQVLYLLGYPVGRTGVIIQLGQYKLLVADVCAGLHTLLTLEALGLLYLNLVRRDSLFRNVTMAILIVPIAFTANVIRVLVLALVTFYFGNEAGQGYLHGFAGIVLFMSALLLIIGFDSVLQYFEGLRQRLRKPPVAAAASASTTASHAA